MTTPHTSGDSVAAPTISDERLAELQRWCELRGDKISYDPIVGSHARHYYDASTALTELQSLRSASAAPVEGVAWQPIETAPCGHKMFLVYSPHSQRGEVDYAFRDFTTEKIMVQTSGGWDCIENYGGPATHWQPLPKAPAATALPSEQAQPDYFDTLYDRRETEERRQASPVEAPTGEKWLRLGKLSIAMRPDGETYVLESEAVAALRTDTAPGLPAQAAKPPTCGVTEDEIALIEHAADQLHSIPDNYSGVGLATEEMLNRLVHKLRSLAARLSKGERGRG